MTYDLSEDQVHIYYCWCDQPGIAGLQQQYLALLSTDERERYERFVFDKDRRQFLIARVLLRTALSRYAPIPPDAWQFVQPRGEKPFLAHHCQLPPLRFNLSNSVRLAACAVTIDDEVGIDVEGVDRHVDLGIARHCFSESELSELASVSDEDEKMDLFIRFWTLKESYVKQRGLGLSLPLTHFSFSLRAGTAPVISFGSEIDDDPQRWQFFQRRIGPRHYLAAAVQRRSDPRCQFVVTELTPLIDEGMGRSMGQ